MLTKEDWDKIIADGTTIDDLQFRIIITALHHDATELEQIFNGKDDLAHQFYRGNAAALELVMQLLLHKEIQ